MTWPPKWIGDYEPLLDSQCDTTSDMEAVPDEPIDLHIRKTPPPIYDRGQFFLDMMDMVRGMEMMDEMIRCECKVGISRTNRLLAITNSDGSTVVEAARFSDLFIKLSRGEYVGRKD